MPRPRLRRRIRGRPNSDYFKPVGIPLRNLEEIELEMINAAERMGISQPTFSRILKTAREKIATSIVQGKAIKINKSK